MYQAKNGLLIQELFQTNNSGYSLRNSDFNIARFIQQPKNCEIMEPDFSKLIEDTVAYLDK